MTIQVEGSHYCAKSLCKTLYFEIPPNEVEVQAVDTEMPYLKSGSTWVYVSIIGEGNGEAVTVIVGNEYGKYFIQAIEWGRP